MHLATASGSTPQQKYLANTTMTINVFHAATDDRIAWYHNRAPAKEPDPNLLLDVSFAFLALAGAADLFRLILEKPRPRYNSYLPAAEQNRLGWPIRRIIQQIYPNVHLRVAAENMTGLVDLSAITTNFHWRPKRSVI